MIYKFLDCSPVDFREVAQKRQIKKECLKLYSSNLRILKA